MSNSVDGHEIRVCLRFKTRLFIKHHRFGGTELSEMHQCKLLNSYRRHDIAMKCFKHMACTLIHSTIPVKITVLQNHLMVKQKCKIRYLCIMKTAVGSWFPRIRVCVVLGSTIISVRHVFISKQNSAHEF